MDAIRPPDLVLVHGAWHGGWCWSRVEPLLREAGRRVVAPTLTGLGDRAHLAGAQVTLGTHVQDVLAAIEAEEVADGFVLVGHSYGGNVVAGVADALRERIGHCVFLDAVVPPPGTTRWRWADFNSPEDRAARLATVAERGAGVALPPPAPAALGVSDPDDAAWLARRMRPMPLGTYLGAIELTRGGADGLPRTYVAAGDPPYAPMRPVVERVRGEPGWRLETIAAGHDMMVTAPRALAALLLSV
ncbi:MAG TPA: alpha/beta hydrolase family protein [Burkholderiaceae bacterium]|nr:alpha/beta hydrolase family protein [Burkholderiaceae bacterium]